jgi:hypothetical protein
VIQVYSLRGSCAGQANIDRKYLFIQDHAARGAYNFQGFKGLTNIVYNAGSKAWEMVSRASTENQVVGSIPGSYLSNVPFAKFFEKNKYKSF